MKETIEMKKTVFLILILLTPLLCKYRTEEPKDEAQLLLEGLWSFQPGGYRADGKYEENTGYYLYVRKEHGVYKFWFWEGLDISLYEYQTAEVDDIKEMEAIYITIMDAIRNFYTDGYNTMLFTFRKKNEFELYFVKTKRTKYYTKVNVHGKFYKENQFLIHPEGIIVGYTKDSPYILPEKISEKK